jgi:dTDP-4-amino-4,6-dideoxygalactose transaminase
MSSPLAHLSLAIHGGARTREAPMPPRRAFGPEELSAVQRVFARSLEFGQDFGYQGQAEAEYTSAFVDYLGAGGFADAICSGTAGLYVTLAALALPKGSHVLLSPVTDPGTVNAVLLNGLVPVLVDAEPGSYNIGREQLEARVTTEAVALLVVHVNGTPAPMDGLMEVARRRGLRVVEDCSQAHGASLDGRKVGTFGDVAVFSTMYSKNHATGGCGGVVFTRDEGLYRLVRAHADRGKPFWEPGFSDRDPGTYLFPALNLNQDELSCAIGLSSLSRLDDVRSRRVAFLQKLRAALLQRSRACLPAAVPDTLSPFFHVIQVESTLLTCSKVDFARALQAEGIPVRPHYPQVVSEWAYLKPHLHDAFPCPNAVAYRDSVFHLLFNENYGDEELADIVAAIEKLERVYAP